MSAHEFGGDWTQEKLLRLRKYLSAYMTIFTANPKARTLTTTYMDAFAGTGYRNPRIKDTQTLWLDGLDDPEAEVFLRGSARIALELEPSFGNYLFIERDPNHAAELRKLQADFPSTAITVIEGEASSFLTEWCRTTDWRKNRAVVFLDPYGMQVDWSLIETIAQTRAIDLWLLFPIGVAVNRLLTTSGPPPEEWAQALDRIFGTPKWRDEFYAPPRNLNLFGEEEPLEKRADFDRISRFFVKRLRTIFAGVADNPLPLYNSKSTPLYLLCFAAGNPRGATTAQRIAQDILRR